VPKDSFSYDEYEDHAGPDFTNPPPKEPFTERESGMLLELVRNAREGRAALSAMKGGRETNLLKKELRDLEQGIVRSLVIGRRYSGFNWPEHRIAVQVKGQRLKDDTVRGMGLLIFSD
jgi:hypothetical protein